MRAATPLPLPLAGFLLGTALLLLAPVGVRAADTSETGEAKSTGKRSSVQMEIVRGAIDYIQGAKHAKVALRWEYLPVGASLKVRAGASGATMKDLVVVNTDLERGDPSQHAAPPIYRDDGKDLLQRILKTKQIPNPLKLDPLEPAKEPQLGELPGSGVDIETWHKNFYDYWHYTARVQQMLEQGVLTPGDYYSLLRDHQLVYVLLSSGGMRVDMSSNGTSADAGDANANSLEAKNKKNLASGINGTVWRIKQYRFPLGKFDNQSIALYRFAISSEMPAFDFFLPGFSGDKLTLQATAFWQARGLDQASSPEERAKLQRRFLLGVLNPALEFEGVDIQVDPLVKAKTEGSGDQGSGSNAASGSTGSGDNAASGGDGSNDQQKAPTSMVSGAFSSSGFLNIGEIVKKNFIGGTETSSVISGPVLSKGKISNMVGVNHEFGNPARAGIRPGFLFGVDPSNSSSLFVGPSLRTDIFTLGVGVRISEHDRSNRTPSGEGTFLKGNLAGMASIDVSRLLGGKRQITTIRLDRSKIGGDLGLSSDEIAQGLASALVLNQGDRAVIIERRETEAGVAIPENRRTRVALRPSTTAEIGHGGYLQFLPAGTYYYVAPPGYSVYVGNNLASEGIEVQANRLVVFRGRVVAPTITGVAPADAPYKPGKEISLNGLAFGDEQGESRLQLVKSATGAGESDVVVDVPSDLIKRWHRNSIRFTLPPKLGDAPWANGQTVKLRVIVGTGPGLKEATSGEIVINTQ